MSRKGARERKSAGGQSQERKNRAPALPRSPITISLTTIKSYPMFAWSLLPVDSRLSGLRWFLLALARVEQGSITPFMVKDASW